jgi:hypothetical protein
MLLGASGRILLQACTVGGVPSGERRLLLLLLFCRLSARHLILLAAHQRLSRVLCRLQGPAHPAKLLRELIY